MILTGTGNNSMQSLLFYNNLCHNGKQRKNEYIKYSGLHCHHIIPKHAGGTDEEDNLTYLTLREHIIAHYLLYRINKHPNDLRSMYMLGAYLSIPRRKIIGEYCRDNKLGFHSASPEQRRTWSAKGIETQKVSGIKNTFYYWSTPDGRSERASLGGAVSCKTNEAFIRQQGAFKDKTKARAAGMKAPKHPATNGKITKKFYSVEEREAFIIENYGWRIGQHNTTPGFRGNTNRRRSVKEGDNIYPSLLHAATEHKVSQATIINWIRSNKKPQWTYAS